MSDNNDQSGARPVGEGGERKPVIIDLPPQEFGRKAGEEEGDRPGAEPEAGAWSAYGGATEPDGRVESEGVQSAAGPAEDEDARLEPDDFGRAEEGAASREHVTEGTGPATGAPPDPERRGRGAGFAALLAAALFGGAIAAGGTALLAQQGFLDAAGEEQTAPPDLTPELASLRSEVEALRQAQTPAVDVAPLQDQVAQLEAAIAQLREQSGGASGTGPALQEVQNRLAELETAAANRPAGPPDPALEARLTDLSAQVEALRSDDAGGSQNPALAGLATRIDEIAGQINDTAAIAPRLDEIAGRIDEVAGRVEALEARPQVDLSGLEGSLGQVQEQLSALGQRIDSAPKEERVVALETQLATLQGTLNEAAAQAQRAETLGAAVAAGALADALESGSPIAAELGALRTLGSDRAALDALQPFAETGLPTMEALRASFEAAAATIDVSTPIPEGAGPVDRLLQSARGLVEVRSANPTEGADPAAVIARMRGSLAAGDLNAALAERNALPEEAKAKTEEWARAAEARAFARELVTQLRSEALSRLGT